MATMVLLTAAGTVAAEASEEGKSADAPLPPAARYAASSGEGVVLLHGDVTVGTVEVHLGDIARLSGPGAEALADLVVAEVSDSAGAAEISLDALREALASTGVNWGKLDLRGYSVCKVFYVSSTSASSQGAAQANPIDVIDVDQMVSVRRYIEAAVRELANFPAEQVVLQFDPRDDAVLDQMFDRDRVVIDVRTRIIPARVSVSILQREDGQLGQRRHISVTVKRQVIAAVATQMIRSGDVITRENCEMRQIELGGANVIPVTDLDEVLGKSARGLLKTGGIIAASSIEAPLAVRRGQTVTVFYQSGQLQIRAIGKAMEDGAVGEMIEIRRDDGRQGFTARVDSPGVAVVELATAARHGSGQETNGS
jgi:flagella basal body P-ring formation protein FlgA